MKRFKRPDILTNRQRSHDTAGRPRRSQLPRESVVPLTEAGPKGQPPARECYGQGQPEDHSLAQGIARLQEVAKDFPVYLVRRKAPWEIERHQFDYLLSRVPWDQIEARKLIPGVTLYAARAELDGQDTLIVVDPVLLDWRKS